jgi:hypothetical protein
VRPATLTVRAPEGATCPHPELPHKSIGQEPVTIQNSKFVRDLLADKSLELVTTASKRVRAERKE